MPDVTCSARDPDTLHSQHNTCHLKNRTTKTNPSLTTLLTGALATGLLAIAAAAQADEVDPDHILNNRAFTATLDLTYVYQNVTSGGFKGPFFREFSDEGNNGNTFSGTLALDFDTAKAGLWAGGTLSARLDGRVGRSVVERTGSISAVNINATLPNVVDSFDDDVLVMTELSYTQQVSDSVSLFGGLLNNAEGDANDIAGSALSTDHFLNSALLYSLVEDATVPNTSLGAGAEFEFGENISGSLLAFGTAETAGEDPFDHWAGTTISTEWTLSYSVSERPGAFTAGLLYGVDADRTNIATDPRLALRGVLDGQSIPTTSSDTWALYFNSSQFLHGDAERGWGVFFRAGVSDGNPNPIAWNVAGGLGGVGFLPGRPNDRWGLGVFYLKMSSEELLRGLGVENEVGGEVFYNVAIKPWCHVTLDAQFIDSAIPRSDNAVAVGLRTNLSF